MILLMPIPPLLLLISVWYWTGHNNNNNDTSKNSSHGAFSQLSGSGSIEQTSKMISSSVVCTVNNGTETPGSLHVDDTNPRRQSATISHKYIESQGQQLDQRKPIQSPISSASQTEATTVGAIDKNDYGICLPVQSPPSIRTNNNNNWRCACEGGFLPPGMLQKFSGMEAMFRMSSGQCYHKQR